MIRGPVESPDLELKDFYEKLLTTLQKPILKEGAWESRDCLSAWEGNDSWDAFVAHSWQGPDGELLLVVVNFAGYRSQCYLPLPFAAMGRGQWQFKDLMSDACYDRQGKDLQTRGLFLDMAPWQYHVFEMNSL